MDGVFVVLFYKVVILQICRGEQRSPAFVFPRIFRYSHILYAFTNHVGDGVLDVPLIGHHGVKNTHTNPNNCTMYRRGDLRSPAFIVPQQFSLSPHEIYKLFDNRKNPNIKDTTIMALPLRTGCRISVKPKLSQAPTMFQASSTAAKSLRSLRVYICSGRGKTVQIISLRYYFRLISDFHMLFFI